MLKFDVYVMELYASSYVISRGSTYKIQGVAVKIALSMDPAPIAPPKFKYILGVPMGAWHFYLMITITKKSIFLLDFSIALIWSLGAFHDIFLLSATFAQILTLCLLGLGIVACFLSLNFTMRLAAVSVEANFLTSWCFIFCQPTFGVYSWWKRVGHSPPCHYVQH